MKQYWVYELCAGRWRYIGMTTMSLKERLRFHRMRISKGGLYANWQLPLSEFPDPDSWHIRAIAGPYETKDEALLEEARQQEIDSDNPGRIWLKKANSWDGERRGAGNPMYGRKQSARTRAMMSVKAAAKRYIRAFFAWLSEPIT